MRNTTISIKESGLRADFFVLKNKICFTYLGEDIKTKRVKNSEKKFYNLVEASYLGGTTNKRRGLKEYCSDYGESYKYISHEVKETTLIKELIIKTSNKLLDVETHFLFHKGIKAVSSYNVVKNVSKEDITLTYVSSFCYLGLAPSNKPNYYIYKANSSWHREAQWSKTSFVDAGIYNGNDFTSMGRYSLSNTGSWSTKEHLPMVVIENPKKKEATCLQVENNGSWNIELGDFINQVYLLGAGPSLNNSQWKKVLKVNETFKTVQVTLSFGKDFEEVIQELTKARRRLRRHSEDLDHLPVIYNDYMHALWDTQTTELIKPLVDLASELNCDEFCIDAGWFAKGSTWWKILGRWEEEKENFPSGGLKAVIDYIKSKGLRAGIWFEIEAVGVDSPILKKMKDEYFFQVDGKKVINNDRYQLNFANKEVYSYALKVIDKAMSLYNLDYIKIDYNVDSGVGNDCDSSSLGDGLLKHNRAYIKWLNEVMDKYPHLTIENCGSGGCRMDYELLKYCPIQSTSDQTNYRRYPYLATNVLTACTPEQAAVWSYPLNDYEKIMPTDEVVIMNMVNSMLGRIHLASFINKLPESQKELIREGIRYYKSIVNFKKNSVPFYPKGTAKFFDKEVSGGLLDSSKGVLGVWNTSGKKDKVVKINLSKYNVKDIKVGYPSSRETLYSFNKETKVLEVKFSEPYGGRIFEFTRD